MDAPQPLSHQAIDEFRTIYREEFGENLSEDEAREIALRLLRLFGMLLQTLSDETPD